ncbi:ABC transporter ATP-binding protein [Halomonas sp. MCCC 1A11036]|uniref:ABC transporter ATP-binding protein n=1 Tax=Billgrantia zhangzhouensis TaxID=2733481 RepID=A0ABS9AFY3_9GAMM|nr:ABC transporter ATP-binding protein [Halomonas zhangzhouensis]MCE8020632.1 ABC transporter ATP-binding protein [Halomonas zhangzhouensis]
MAALELENVSIRIGQARILNDVSLQVPAGSFTCLLGPSGCGKTTLLRSVAGFAPLSAGDIRIGDRSIAGLPPERRETAMVFQSYALWPHMNVGENLAYPLKLRGVSRGERERRVAAMLERLDLAHCAKRPIGALSGGQRQRIALGRALIIDPPILLLDEPLSNLDAAIRRTLRTELRDLQRRLGITTLMVTHDQEEALSLADRIVLMRDGRIIQVADPETLYTAPADLDTARFLGVDNLVPEGGATLAFRSTQAHAGPRALHAGLRRQGRVIDSTYAGGAWRIRLAVAELELTAMGEASLAAGTPAWISVPDHALMRFDAHRDAA